MEQSMTRAGPVTGETDPSIRRAVPADLAAIERIITAAFTPYIPRLGRPPGVMKNDYAAFIAAGAAFVRTAAPAGEGDRAASSGSDDGEGAAGAGRRDGAIEGVIVLVDEENVLYVDTLGVDPAAHGRGHGRALLDFAAAEGRRRGFPALRLCTNLVMHENLSFYRHLGWQETHRGVQAGFERVFYRKAV
jgi:ribosomal protein S18 acetylase RimI-like enzyme